MCPGSGFPNPASDTKFGNPIRLCGDVSEITIEAWITVKLIVTSNV